MTMETPLNLADLERAMKQIRPLPRVMESRWLPPDTVIVMNDLNLPIRQPEGWDAWSLDAKVNWAVDNRQMVVLPVRVTEAKPDPDAIVDEPEPPEPVLPDNDPVPDDRPPEEYA